MDEPKENFSSLSLPVTKQGGIHRLRIVDLLLITLGTAVALWIMQVSRPTNPRHVIPTVAFAPLYGAAIASVLLAAIQTRQPHDPIATQPGHWLLLLFGSVFLGVGLLFRGAPTLDGAPQTPALAIPCLISGVVLLFLSAFLFLYLLVAYDDSLQWRQVFRLLGATLIVPVVGGCCLAPFDSFAPSPWIIVILALCVVFGPPILLIVATIMAVIADFRHHESRDFWHWLGVATFFGAPVHVVVTALIEALVP